MEKKENKTMKKGLTIAALALLLGIVGYTGGNTFAKYITSNSVPATEATVAQWGYTVSVGAEKLWGTDYVFDTNASVVTTDDNGVTVNSSDTGKRVAPGTTGYTTLKVQGQAEVLSKLNVTSTVTDVELHSTTTLDDPSTQDVDESLVYSPIKWSISGDAIIGSENKLPVDLSNQTAADVADFLDKLSKTNIAAKTEINIDLTITWAWAFEGNNTYDTYLGLLAASKPVDGYTADLTTSYALSVTLEQLEKPE